jgi:hypothetical protein
MARVAFSVIGFSFGLELGDALRDMAVEAILKMNYSV